MAPRFDLDAQTLDLAVADLLDTQLLRSLGFANRGGYERMWLGQAIHSRYQERAMEEDPTYQREVTLRCSFEHRGWTITVQGRADGLRRDDEDLLVVEEIKSVRRGAKLAPTTRELYERQANLYAWMLARERPKERVRAELILIEIGGEGVAREPVEANPKALDASIKRRVDGLLRSFEARRQARDARREAARGLPFPYPEMRKGQDTILEAVGRALDGRDHLFVEAPTGIGKTVAALHPTLQYALEHDLKVYVLTAKTLQQDMATAVVSLLNRDGVFRSLRLRAKAKMCANDQVLCHEEYCPYAKDYYLKLQRTGVIPRLLEDYETLLPDLIHSTARKAEVCPFEVSLELGQHVQVMVCDYNYAFDPYVALGDFTADAELDNTVLVIDEIHNLVDRGRRYYSPALSSIRCREAAEAVALGGAPIHHQLAELCLKLGRLIADTVVDHRPAGGERSWALEQNFPDEALWRLRPKFDRAFVDYLEHRRETKTLTADDLFVDLYFEFLRFLSVLMQIDDAFSCTLEQEDASRGYYVGTPDHRFKILCKDPSRFLGEIINRCHSVIGLSATLSPPEFYRDLLGFDPHRFSHLRLPNPFPTENRRVVIDASVATAYRERAANVGRIGERLAELAEAVPGNTLALFPSYRFLADVAGFVRPSSKRVLVQNPGDGDRQREEILDTLRSAIFGDVLLLAVAGGVFAEGVDYPGDVLKAVAVVGPCLPGLTLEQQLLQAYYDERFDRGFEYAFVVPGMTRVVQAAGRLIRSPDDQGVIALFDKRFLWSTYRNHLPQEWLSEDGSARDLIGEPRDVAEQFFASVPVAAGGLDEWDDPADVEKAALPFEPIGDVGLGGAKVCQIRVEKMGLEDRAGRSLEDGEGPLSGPIGGFQVGKEYVEGEIELVEGFERKLPGLEGRKV
ncbi:MAG: helicase C-terminal domain-containing protein, partial [Acidobacteriota bacterium]